MASECQYIELTHVFACCTVKINVYMVKIAGSIVARSAVIFYDTIPPPRRTPAGYLGCGLEVLGGLRKSERNNRKIDRSVGIGDPTVDTEENRGSEEGRNCKLTEKNENLGYQQHTRDLQPPRPTREWHSSLDCHLGINR